MHPIWSRRCPDWKDACWRWHRPDKRYGEAAAGLLTAGVGILVESGLDAVGGPGAATDVDGLSDAPGKDD